MARLNINTAGADKIVRLDGVGPHLAKQIVADREKNGPFKQKDDLARVKGISVALINRFRNNIVLTGGQPASTRKPRRTAQARPVKPSGSAAKRPARKKTTAPPASKAKSPVKPRAHRPSTRPAAHKSRSAKSTATPRKTAAATPKTRSSKTSTKSTKTAVARRRTAAKPATRKTVQKKAPVSRRSSGLAKSATQKTAQKKPTSSRKPAATTRPARSAAKSTTTRSAKKPGSVKTTTPAARRRTRKAVPAKTERKVRGVTPRRTTARRIQSGLLKPILEIAAVTKTEEAKSKKEAKRKKQKPAKKQTITFTKKALKKTAKKLGIDRGVLQAIISVLGAKKGYLSNGNPVLRFEGNTFYQLLDAQKKYDAKALAKKHPNLIQKKWNGKHYIGGKTEYKRLSQAQRIAKKIAPLAASVGLFEVRAFNFRQAGFDSVADFYKAQKKSPSAQLEAFHSVLNSKKVRSALKKKDWKRFVALYAGPGYGGKDYHLAYAKAYRKLRKKG